MRIIDYITRIRKLKNVNMEIPDAKSYIYQHTVSFILSGADDKYL